MEIKQCYIQVFCFDRKIMSLSVWCLCNYPQMNNVVNKTCIIVEVKELLICWPDYGYTTNNRGIINKTKKMPSNSPSREDKNQAWYKFSNSPWYCPHHNITLHFAICQHIFRYNLDEYCHNHPSWLSTPNIPGICTSIARKYECKGLGYSLSTLSHSGIKDQRKM